MARPRKITTETKVEEVKEKTIPVSTLTDREKIAYWELSRLYQIYGNTIMNRVCNIFKGTSN